MIRLYTDMTLLNGKHFIRGVDATFNIQITGSILDDIDIQVMKDIDNAVLLDAKLGTIKTPYGICSIESLSTGCKCIILARHLVKDGYHGVLNVSECGASALSVLCNYVDNTDVCLFLSHLNNLMYGLSYEFLVNDKETNSHIWRGI